jgi:hypothetical protein
MNQKIQRLQDAKELIAQANGLVEQAHAMLTPVGFPGITAGLEKSLAFLGRAGHGVESKIRRQQSKAGQQATLDAEPDYVRRAIQYLESTLHLEDL